MIAFSKKYVTAVVAFVAVVTIAIALVYSQKKKSSYNALASSAADGVSPLVIGGETLDRDVWEKSRRYLVSLRSETAGGVIYHSCGATLISSRVVLTAARELKSAQRTYLLCTMPLLCTYSPAEYQPFLSIVIVHAVISPLIDCFDDSGAFSPMVSVDFNRYAQNDDEGVTTIPLCQTEFNSCSDDTNLAYAIRHPDWNTNTFENDVALIILPEGLEIVPSIRPVRLNRQGKVPKDGQEMEVFGWGQTSNSPNVEDPNEIQTGTIEYLNNRECQRLYTNGGYTYTITQDMMCARTDGGVDSSLGDSGMCNLRTFCIVWAHHCSYVSFHLFPST